MHQQIIAKMHTNIEYLLKNVCLRLVIFLGSVTSGDCEIEITPHSQVNYSTRDGSSIKRKLEWSAE